MPDNGEGFSRAPESRRVPAKRTRPSLVWLIPLVAAVAGIWVAATRILGEGPKITIVFRTAEGLEAGKTKIDYNGVEVGTLTEIRLSDDHLRVVATAQMAPKTEGFLVEDTQFWVVRPRISGGTVTGLGTLLSGAYIDMRIGESKKSRRSFEALEEPPIVKEDMPGRYFVLETSDLGSVDRGTPIYFRRLKVGEVASYELEDDGKSFRVRAYVNAPYDQYVTPATRFWHASGIDLSLSASGLTLETQSLVSILIGGIAFEAPPNTPAQAEAEEGASFTLFADRAAAFRPAARDPQTYVVVFEDEVRGLAVGAPVDFRGVPIGEVVDVAGQLNAKSLDFQVRVTLQLDAERFGVQVADLGAGVDREAFRRKLVDSLVEHGIRAQLRTGSLLTGALYVAIDFFPDAPPVHMDWSQQPPQLPTIPGELQAVEKRLASILEKVDQIPFKKIGADLDGAIVDLDHTLASARRALDSANEMVEPNSVLGQQLDSTLQEVSDAARALRLLADYLERHPESLIRGKKGEPK